MQLLSNIDLSNDPAASVFVKDEVVQVVFASRDGEIQSRVGPNRYWRGDALITGSTGDCWSVSRDRFELRYVPVLPAGAGQDGPYRARAATVLARQLPTAFSIARSEGGDLLCGQPNDWLLQYAPGDYGVVDNARFQRVYRPAGK